MSTDARAGSRVLIASDDRELNAALASLIADIAPAISAGTCASVLTEVNSTERLHLVMIGETCGDSTVLDVLQAIKQQRPEVAVLVLSALPTIAHAAEAIRRGAEDFVPVPYSAEVVRKEVERILEAAELRDRVAHLDRLVATRFGFEQIISRSPRMRAVFDRANAAARNDTPVLILRETGTGKKLIAQAVQANGRRAKRS